MRAWISAVVVLMLVWPGLSAGELVLPPGFTATVYVTGEGFDTGTAQGVRGMPAVSTLAFDEAGFLYLARTGRRYVGGEVEDIWPVYRVPPGGARLTPKTEPSFFYGPPLPNPQVGAVRNGRDLFLTTFDRDRKIGVLYRITEGRIELVAGGTPPPGRPRCSGSPREWPSTPPATSSSPIANRAWSSSSTRPDASSIRATLRSPGPGPSPSTVEGDCGSAAMGRRRLRGSRGPARSGSWARRADRVW